MLDTETEGVGWYGNALRMHVTCLSRCRIVELDQSPEAALVPFPRVLVTVLPEDPLPIVDVPEWEWFPRRLALGKSSPCQRLASRPQTRAQTRMRSRISRGTLVGVPFSLWKKSRVDHVLSVIFRKLADPDFADAVVLDENLIKNKPHRRASPTQWSYWLAALLRCDEEAKLEFLEENITLLRLQAILRFLTNLSADAVETRENHVKVPRKRPRSASQQVASASAHVAKRGRSTHGNQNNKQGTKSTIQFDPWPCYDVHAFERLEPSRTVQK